jgi:hypothetical protein
MPRTVLYFSPRHQPSLYNSVIPEVLDPSLVGTRWFVEHRCNVVERMKGVWK